LENKNESTNLYKFIYVDTVTVIKIRTRMAWACCKHGWYNGSKEVTRGPIRRNKIKIRPVKWIGNVYSDLRNMDIKM
jgi:hypothetical protein